MNASDRGPPDDERTLEFLAGQPPPAGAASDPGPCPDRNLLAGLADATLLPEERDALERHLARCEACGRFASELIRMAAEAPTEAREEARRGDALPRRGRRITWPRIILAAAALLAIAGGSWWLREIATTPASTKARLHRVADRLAAERPALFARFQPLSAEELGARPPVARGDLELGFPVGKLLERRPVFRWRPAPGVTEWVVTLRRQEGTRVWTERTEETTLAFSSNRPGLEPGGNYLWDVAGTGPLGRVEAAQAFTLATDEERQRFEDARREIERVADRRVARLVIAHYAIRRGLLGEAERASRDAWRNNADDPIVRETLVHVLRQLRSPEAEWIEKRKVPPLEKD